MGQALSAADSTTGDRENSSFSLHTYSPSPSSSSAFLHANVVIPILAVLEHDALTRQQEEALLRAEEQRRIAHLKQWLASKKHLGPPWFSFNGSVVGGATPKL